MKTIFFVGNKRSGTTLLMKLLNLHPKIYITNESDLIWILFLKHNNLEIRPYPHDSPKGFNKTVRYFMGVIEASRHLKMEERFEAIVNEIKVEDRENPGKGKVIVTGDQKMFQHADPEVFKFIVENFSDPYFIHIHRHPFYVVRSQKNFQRETGAPDYDDIWKNRTNEELLELWWQNEQRVLDIKRNGQVKVIDLCYDELVSHPFKEMKRISRFIDLEFPLSLYVKSYLSCRKSNRSASLDCDINEKLRRMIADLGYDISLPSKSAGKLLICKLENLLKHFLLKFLLLF